MKKPKRRRLTARQLKLIERFREKYETPIKLLIRIRHKEYKTALRYGLSHEEVESECWQAVVIASLSYRSGRGTSFATWVSIRLCQHISRLLWSITFRLNNERRHTDRLVAEACPSRRNRRDAVPKILWSTRGVELAESEIADRIRQGVETAIKSLPPKHRRAIRLRFGLGRRNILALTIRRIAERMKIGDDTASRLISEGMKAIREPLSIVAELRE